MKLSKKQSIVLRAIYNLRAKNQTRSVSSGDVEEWTKSRNDDKEISRNNWNPARATNQTWRAIGEAIHGRLHDADPIEQVIRGFKGKATSSEESLALEEKIEELIKDLSEAVKKKSTAEAELKEFKERTYREQCEDAHYRINFEKNLARSKRLTESADIDKKSIQALRAEVIDLKDQLKALGQINSGAKPGKNVKKLKPPKIFEPYLSGSNSNEKVSVLLERYVTEIDKELSLLKKDALKEASVEIVIVFHHFNIASPDFYTIELPFRPAVQNRLVFSCFAPTAVTRRKIYKSISQLATFPPQVVLVEGVGKLVTLPASNRTSENDHEWLAYQARNPKSGVRAQKVDITSEGYDTVMVRRHDDE